MREMWALVFLIVFTYLFGYPTKISEYDSAAAASQCWLPSLLRMAESEKNMAILLMVFFKFKGIKNGIF